MKTKNIIRQMYQACIDNDIKQEKRLYFKLLKKSLKHKKTHVVK